MQEDISNSTTGDANIELDLPLVHRILLTDPGKFDTLQEEKKSPRLTFEQFQEQVLQSNDSNYVVKRAFHDHLKESIEIKDNWLPMHNLLLELYTSIRSLVPNRPDLHVLLQDPKFEESYSNSHFDAESKIRLAAQSLAQLESEFRAETTVQWIQYTDSVKQDSSDISNKDDNVSFWIMSILYFIEKAEVCAKEKQDFYLTHVIAPRLYRTGEGFSIERSAFRKKFPPIPPTSQQWIFQLIEFLDQNQKERLRHSTKERQGLVVTGWIQSILFETEQETPLPEIFALDLTALLSIRKVTRAAAAGCSLGWHACRAVGRSSTDIVLQEEQQGTGLVQAMNERSRYSTVDAYEEAVADSLLSLTQKWNDGVPLQPSIIEMLRGQTTAVLRGVDPVLKLLDERMKQVFVRLATLVNINEIPGGPIAMQTGQSALLKTGTQLDSPFVHFARQEFCQTGLAFYSHDLAHAVEYAIRIADLAYQLYADEFLDQMILDVL